MFDSVSSAAVSLVVALSGGFGGTGLWSLVQERAESPPACVCECDCSISTVEAVSVITSTRSPSADQQTPSPGLSFRYSTHGDSFWTGFAAACFVIALLAAEVQVYRLYSQRKPQRVERDHGQEFSREAQQLFRVKDGAGDRGPSSSVSSPARSRRRGGGVLVRSIAGP